MSKKKILFAVGGTGGHLFPAQALARDLKQKIGQFEILFGGGRLGSNQFFQKLQFPFREISSSSPFRTNPLKAAFQIGRGIVESYDLIKEFSPDLIIGFGSFYSFPLIATAWLKKIPYILVESNAFPGKVNRLFSSKALFSALQFEEASQYLKGKTTAARMPCWSQELEELYIAPSDARKYYQLHAELFTLLVFGGSQGAEAINQAVVELKLDFPFQVLHLCGKNQDAKGLSLIYKERQIPACVKSFEERMYMAWRAADLAICRAGSGTLAEMEAFQVPAVLVPWPGATDLHQHKNAKRMEEIGGGLLLDQSQMQELPNKIKWAKENLLKMQSCLKDYHIRAIENLDSVILNYLKGFK